MVRFVLIGSILASMVTVWAQGTTSVNTPTGVVQCEPTLLGWSGGTAPYFVTIVAQGNPSDTLESFPQTSATSIQWTVDLPAGTAFSVAVKDATGSTSFSGGATIGAGTTTTCTNSASGSVSGSATGSSSSVSSAVASVSSSVSSAISSITSSASSVVNSITSSPTTSKSSTTSSPSSSSKPNSASTYQTSLVTIFGAVFAYLVVRA